MEQDDATERPRRVLLIEDDEADRSMVHALLAESGLGPSEVHDAHTTADALAALGSHPIDLVLLDLGLPDAHDITALSTLLALQGAPPVVVLTGGDESALGEATLRMGAEDFLPKGVLAGTGASFLLDRVMRYAVTRHHQRLLLERESAELRWMTAKQQQVLDRVTTDLQGPVTALYGLVSTLAERHKSMKAAERQQLLDKLLTSAQSMSFKLTKLVAEATPAREASGARELLAMSDVVPAAINAVGERPVGTHFTLEGDLPRVWGDPLALQRCLSEVIRNAVVHAPGDHPPTVRITVSAFGNGVRISVADDGVPVPVSHRSLAFEPGVTLVEGSNRLGLGLTQVRAIVAAHGGSVWIGDSDMGGTAVTITIPQREGAR